MFKVIIAGSREFSDYSYLAKRCDFFLHKVQDEIEIVSGTARGADTLGEFYAKERGFKCTRFPADWDQFGKAAGFIRNEEMAKYADALIAFPLGKSSGTRDMINRARKHLLSIRYGSNESAPNL